MRKPHPTTALLDAEHERRLAQEIEAGVLAQHLVLLAKSGAPDSPGEAADRKHSTRPNDGGDAQDSPSPAELAELVARGERAKSAFLLANLGLVGLAASATARRTGLDEDELFQEGFLGLVEALQRFDHLRGCRFSTYAMTWIKSSVLRAAQTRLGAIELPLGRIARLRSLLHQQSELSQRERREVGWHEASVALGVPSTLERDLAHLQRSSLDEVGDVAAELFEEECDVHALLARLSPRQRRVVELRFGFRGAAQPRLLVAGAQGISVREVRRIELEALEALRAGAVAVGERRLVA